MYVQRLSFENFRCFETFDFSLQKRETFIIGGNGTGKTTLLWGLLLFFRGFNFRVTESEFKDKPTAQVLGEELKFLLNWEFPQTTPFLSKLNKDSDSNSFNISGTFSEKGSGYPKKFSFDVKTNGNLKFENFSHSNLPFPKIRYAYVGCGEPKFTSALDETSNRREMLCSSVPCSRTNFYSLSQENRKSIEKYLGLIFSIEVTLNEKKDDLLVMIDGVEIEILFSGSAFRKVFVALVLLHVLIEKNGNPIKVYLLEEPEALLYPRVTTQFIRIVQELCQIHDIQLVVVTTSTSPFNETGYFLQNKNMLFLQNKKLQPLNEKINMLIHHELLNIGKSKKLILCEGPTDVTFLRHIFKVSKKEEFKQPLEFRTFGDTLRRNEELDKIRSALAFLDPTLKIRVIRDKDFRIEEKEGSNIKDWDLPSIESYIFLCYCIQQVKQNNNPFTFLTSKILNQFMLKYWDSFSSQEQQTKKNREKANSLWETAINSIEKQGNADIYDFISVSQVLQGHLWVEIISGKKFEEGFLEVLQKYVTDEELETLLGRNEIQLFSILKWLLENDENQKV